MNNMKFNVAFAALLLAGIIAMFTGFASKTVVPETHLEKDAVTVASAEGAGAAGGPAKAAMPEPILALLATADIERGKSVSKACAACHNFDKGGANGVGPGLWGVVGHKKQAHEGFAYSGSLAEKGGDVWTYSELNEFLWKPKAYASGTKMNFIGVKKPEDRAALIAWLRTLADSPAALPSQADIDAEKARLAPEEAAPPAATTDAAAAPEGEAAPEAAAPVAAEAVAEEKAEEKAAH